MRFIVLTAALTLAAAEGDVELTFQPPADGGLYKAGTYVGITCKVRTEMFDLTQVWKYDADGVEHEISTNDFLTTTFRDTGRYSLMSSSSGDNDEYKLTRISIRELRGADSGNIECRHILIDGTTHIATEDFKVIVKPEAVEILHYDAGSTAKVDNGADLVLSEGEDHGVICRVRIVDSADSPDVDITLDGTSIVSTFSKEEEKTQSGSPGLIQYDNQLLYEWLTVKPDIDQNGKNLTCFATMPGYENEPVSQWVNLIVHYAPRLECDAAMAQVGGRYNITCRAKMFPAVETAAVSWVKAVSTVTLTMDDPVHERHRLIVNEKADNSYEFIVAIDEVMGEDFGMYTFEVQNSHSPGELEVELVEVATTPSPDSDTTPEPTPETKTDPPNNDPTEETEEKNYDSIRAGPSTGAANVVTSQLFSLLVLLMMCVFH